MIIVKKRGREFEREPGGICRRVGERKRKVKLHNYIISQKKKQNKDKSKEKKKQTSKNHPSHNTNTRDNSGVKATLGTHRALDLILSDKQKDLHDINRICLLCQMYTFGFINNIVTICKQIYLRFIILEVLML